MKKKTIKPPAIRGKPSKFGNVRIGGHASIKEHGRSTYLHMLERAGKISELREQVPYELIPAQYGEFGVDLKGRPVRKLLEKACRYVADFVYKDEFGNTVVEDTKGFKTPEYIMKRKLMLYFHGIIIKET